MASPTQQTPSSPLGRRRGTSVSSVAHSITSASQQAFEFTGDLVLHHDPAPGFMAAAAGASSRAPSVKEIRSGTFNEDGWPRDRAGSQRSARSGSHGSGERPEVGRDSRAFVERFAPLAEENTRISSEVDRRLDRTPVNIPDSTPLTGEQHERTDHDRIPSLTRDERTHSSGYQPPPKLPWTQSTAIALKAFWKWFLTIPGFLITIYGLNIVAWGGMLFLLLCNASPYMCWAPIHTPENQRHMSPAAALSLPGPYYKNCNDINSPRRIWIEIDSQILNALFCVTGFGLAPWRFRDLYYLLRWRFTSEKKAGRMEKLYGMRILAGIYKSWFRLPGSETLDNLSTQEYLNTLEKTSGSTTTASTRDLEAFLSTFPENDVRIPLPLSKQPPTPPTSIRAPPTAPWKLDFFVWCQAWNTFFQCCLCGFMWGMNRYARPPWSTGLFVALACGIAGVGGWMSFKEGKKVKKVEGVVRKDTQGGDELREVRTNATGHESVHLGGKTKQGAQGEGVV